MFTRGALTFEEDHVPELGLIGDDLFHFADGVAPRLEALKDAIEDSRAQWKETLQGLLGDGPDSFIDLLKHPPHAGSGEGADPASAAGNDAADGGDAEPADLATPEAETLQDVDDADGPGFFESSREDYAELREGLVEWLADFRETLADVREDLAESRSDFIADLRTHLAEVRTHLVELRELFTPGADEAEQQEASEQQTLGAYSLWQDGVVSVGTDSQTSHAFDPVGFL